MTAYVATSTDVDELLPQVPSYRSAPNQLAIIRSHRNGHSGGYQPRDLRWRRRIRSEQVSSPDGHTTGWMTAPPHRLPEAYSEPPAPARARYARPPANPCRGGRTRARAEPRRRDGLGVPGLLWWRSTTTDPRQTRTTSRGRRCQTLATFPLATGPIEGDLFGRRSSGFKSPESHLKMASSDPHQPST